MPEYPDPHPDIMEMSRVKPCRSLGCSEVIGHLFTDWTVSGVPGFCRRCYVRLATPESAEPHVAVYEKPDTRQNTEDGAHE